MTSVNREIDFACPDCNRKQPVARNKIGEQIYCKHCGEQVYVARPMSNMDKLAVGLVDEEENDHPGNLKIDGISNVEDDHTSWSIKCHVCDSVLLVTDQQVGTQIKCNDCFSMLSVQPKRIANLEKDVTDGSDMEVVHDDVPAPVAPAESIDDSDELTLLPAVELAPEVTDMQKETMIEDLVDEEPFMEITEEHLDEPAALALEEAPIPLDEGMYVKSAKAPATNPMFGPPASAAEEDDEDDSDEMIEMLDVSPEELNQEETPVAATTSGSPAPGAPNELPRMPRQGKKQPTAIPVNSPDDDAPIRVHAKRRPRKAPTTVPERLPAAKKQLDFDTAKPGEILDKAMGVLKSGNIWIWAFVAIVLMATGSAIWQWLQPHRLDVETTAVAQRILYWGSGMIFGQGVFFAGYIVILFVGGVIFRETALGETRVKSVAATDAADFTSTMLLFGFSMFVAALPCLFFGYMFVSIPFQFLLAGFFLYAAWKNQGAFSIISGSIAKSFSTASASWKNWFTGAGIAAAAGIIGGMLMEVYLPIISVFTSIAGAVIVVFATLLYAAITGWHCGNVVEKMSQAE